MNACAFTCPPLQRRLIAQRRSRAFFSPGTTQQVPTTPLLAEVARAVIALGGLAAWGIAALLLAGS